MYIIDKSLAKKVSLDGSMYNNEVMQDGKVFSPSVHRRFLPSQYISMVQGGYLLPASPLKFTWSIRRWLGLEISNIIRMRNTPSLRNECKVRASFLGKQIFNYLIDKKRLKESLIYGRCVGRRDGYEWVYLVPEKWIYENLEELYSSYLAAGCYYTITSLQAFGKLSGVIEGVSKGGNTISIILSNTGDSDDSVSSTLIKGLRKDKVFRDSLTASCLSKLNLSEGSFSVRGRYLKDEEGAIEKFKEFYIKEYNTRKVTKELLSKYGVPVVGDCSPKFEGLQGLYVD